MRIDEINRLLADDGIRVVDFLSNTKASDYFVRTIFCFEDGTEKNVVVPYIYRRSGLSLDSEENIASYLRHIKPFFEREAMEQWRKIELDKWQERERRSRRPEELVTIEFFKVLLSFNEEVDSFPVNSNPQRRFQDIKDQGYVVSIYPIGNKQWGKMLLPLPLNDEMGYEVFSPQFKARVIRLFKGVNAYEARATPPRSLIPDHKFSEIRWDENTKGENPMDMSDEEIISKFQLLDNQRNQQKREICRICYQSGKRGQIFGIDFYPQGTGNWDPSIPSTGKEAEKGCIGCPWYDINEWRNSINKLIKDFQEKL
jgi:hypothetical protein